MIGEIFDDAPRELPHIERSTRWKEAEKTFDAAVAVWKRALAKGNRRSAAYASAARAFEAASAKIDEERGVEDARIAREQQRLLAEKETSESARREKSQPKLFG